MLPWFQCCLGTHPPGSSLIGAASMLVSGRLLPKDILNIQGALYFCTFFMGIVNSLIVQPVAAAERTVFYRERAARMYSVIAYSLSMVPSLVSP